MEYKGTLIESYVIQLNLTLMNRTTLSLIEMNEINRNLSKENSMTFNEFKGIERNRIQLNKILTQFDVI